MGQALHRLAADEARVLPVIIRAIHWQDSPIRALSPLPSDGTPVTMFANRDQAWGFVIGGIRLVILNMAGRNPPSPLQLLPAPPEG